MALQKTVTYKEVPMIDAYHRIHEMTGKKEGAGFSVRFTVEIAANSTSEVIEIKECIEYQFMYDLVSTDNAITQAYDYLKTLPEFDGAIDV